MAVSKAEALLTGLSQEEKENFQKECRKADKFLVLLGKIIDNRMKMQSQISIDDPQWVVKRAYYDGKSSELAYLSKLFSVKE